MQHELDNPVWNAMTSVNSHLASGTGRVRFFPEDLSPFVGLENINDESLYELYEQLPAERTVGLFTPETIEIPGYLKVVSCPMVYQMVRENTSLPVNNAEGIIPLSIQDVPAMLELTKLTNPGPFYKRTIEFGNYTGIMQSSQLAAMAGQRMHLNNYVEFSAICTHPGYAGRGFARRLIQEKICDVTERSLYPFLHVMTDNKKAIQLYERLGFVIRRTMNIYVLKK